MSSSSLHSPHDATDDRSVGSLDWRQIIGGAGAASVVAYASSRLGIAGTIVGAAIMSVLAALTSTYLARAAHQTERQVRRVTRHKGAAASAHAPTAAESRDTGPDVALPHPEPADTSFSPASADPDAAPIGEQGKRPPWRAIAIFAGVVFAVTIAVVVVVGIATGAERPAAPLAPASTPTPTPGDPEPTVTTSTTGEPGSTARPTATATSTATPTASATSQPTGAPSPSRTAPGATGSPTSGG